MASTLKYLLYGLVALAGVTNAAPACGRADTEERTFEAEDATLGGTTVDTAQAGFTGEIHTLIGLVPVC
jgi:mannan endo-1,4-beta-mannosidase